MSKILLINGSPNEKGCTYTALQELAASLEKNGVDSEILWLGKKPMQDCLCCGFCGKNQKCAIDDEVNKVTSRLDEFDGIVCGTPVYYGGPTGRLCSFLNRLMFSNMTAGRMAGKLAASVVSCRRGGASETFNRLNMFYLNNNMHLVGSQYWNSVHGFTPDDVQQDLEGLQTMRTLGQNIAWLLKSINAGKEKGVDFPKYEAVTPTHFIM